MESGAESCGNLGRRIGRTGIDHDDFVDGPRETRQATLEHERFIPDDETRGESGRAAIIASA
jgi:hypothetical protein